MPDKDKSRSTKSFSPVFDNDDEHESGKFSQPAVHKSPQPKSASSRDRPPERERSLSLDRQYTSTPQHTAHQPSSLKNQPSPQTVIPAVNKLDAGPQGSISKMQIVVNGDPVVIYACTMPGVVKRVATHIDKRRKMATLTQ